MARCRLPATAKVVDAVERDLTTFDKSSWIHKRKTTTQQQKATSDVPSPDPVQTGWEQQCTRVVERYICDEPGVTRPDLDSGCVLTEVECIEWNLVFVPEQEGPGGGSGGSDDGDPCTPCTNDQGGPAMPCESQPGGGDGIPQGCAVDSDFEILDPCDQADQLEGDSIFKNKMQSLETDANSKNFETGYLITKQSLGNTYDYVEGDPGDASIKLNITNKIDGYIHSHYNGTLSIFSPQDLRAIYQIYNADKMGSLSSFTAGVVTSQGSTYILKVNNVNNFLSFGNQYLSDETSFGAFNDIYDGLYNIKVNNSVNDNEKGFLQMLDQLNSGVKLFKGNTNDFDTWQAKKINSNNNVVDGNCN